MVPKTEGNNVEFFVIQSVYKKEKKPMKNEFGMKVSVEVDKFVKEVYARVVMEKNYVGPYGQYVGSKGELLKNRTLLYNKLTDSYYKVAHSLEEIKSVMQTSASQIGFKKDN